MAHIISDWLNPNNFAVLRDKFNAIVSVLSGGPTGNILVKKSNDNGDFEFKSLFDLMPTGQPWNTFVTDLSEAPFNNKWVKMDGKTISNLSGTGDYKGDTYRPLFIFLWDKFGDTEAPVTGGRGASGLADYNANKKIAIPDYRGVFEVGFDDRASDPSNGIWDADYNTMGKLGGEKRHTLTSAESGQKAISQAIGRVWNGTTFFGDVPGGGGTDVPTTSGFNDVSLSVSASDAGSSHENRPPYRSVNKIIKI